MSANVRITKEAREVLPILGGVAGAIVVPFLVWGANAQAFAYFAYALGCVILAASAFGNEVHHRTISTLLSQPVPRGLMWREKTGVAACAVATSLAVILVCGVIWQSKESADSRSVLTLVIVAICAWCGAPYFALVARNTIVGVAMAASVPCSLLALGALTFAIVGKWYPQILENDALSFYGGVLFLLLYSAVVCRRGFVYFNKFEVLDAASRELALPARVESLTSRLLSSIAARLTGPFGALLKKEFHLQQTTFLIAGIFCFFALVGLGMHPIYSDAAEVIWGIDFAVFLILVPFLAGALPLAEEQGWGVADWQLVLPPSGRMQWVAKMLVTLPTSLLLGLALPFLLVYSGALIGLGGPAASIKGQFLDFIYTSSLVALGQLAVTSAAVYAGSRSSNSLRAILMGMGISISALACAVWAGSIFLRYVLRNASFALLLSRSLSRGAAEAYIWSTVALGLFVLVCLLQCFGFSNFRRRDSSGFRVAAQLLGLLGVASFFGILIATLNYR
jgi:hypothetical protein